MTDKAPSPKDTASVPKKKGKQDEAIIGTNDYSIISKRSVEKLYQRDEPEFLRPFVGKFKRRAPLINRGYWLRMRAIEHVIKTFLDEPTSKSKIILNLGCGYEPLPFRILWKYKIQCRNVKFIDIDFPQLMHQKVQIIHQNTLLTDLLHGSSGDTLPSEPILMDDKHYSAIGCDLGDVARIRELFSMLELQDHAVLFLAEVSMVYMKPDQATNLIKLCGELPDGKCCPWLHIRITEKLLITTT
jgi:tRNA wybutosine-synthesizing protein 4